jgi:DNA repair photolyase
MLYKTGVEYGDFTMNHIQGCSHGCKYPCYAFLLAKRFGKVKTYEEWMSPKLVCNTMALLKSEIPVLKSKIKSVQLCFTTDPFMFEYGDIAQLSLSALELLNKHEIKCTILTKGVLPQCLTEFSNNNEFGITLVSLDEAYRTKFEPNTAPYNDRLTALKFLHNNGCKTWVSIEPYPTPNIIDQYFENILNSIYFVDKIIFGRTNYNKEIAAYPDYKQFYNDHANLVINFCKQNRIKYHIKNGTITQDLRKKSKQEKLLPQRSTYFRAPAIA